MTAKPEKFPIPPGSIAITTWGSITPETSQAITEAARFCERNGLINVKFDWIIGTLVDKSRNEAVSHMLAQPADKHAYVLFIDADMTFLPDTFLRLLQTAYGECPWADIVGGWCPLRGEPYLPTIDTGTGIWEPHEPRQGVLEVMRTGSACVLIKRPVFEKVEPPWYGIRPAPRAIDTIAEFDNYARIKFDGGNPFRRHPEWEMLQNCAREEAARGAGRWSFVGEDSNFCDRAKAEGFRIVVQTNVVCGHVERHVIEPADHREAIQKSRRMGRVLAGILD